MTWSERASAATLSRKILAPPCSTTSSPSSGSVASSIDSSILSAVGPCVRLAAEFAFQQDLTPRLLAEDEIWRYCPKEWA